MKKTSLIVLLFIACFFAVFILTGCGEVTYSVKIDSSGARTYRYKVELNDKDSDYQTQKNAVKTLFSYYADNRDRVSFIEVDNDPNVLILQIYYESATDYYIANGITGDEPNSPADFEYNGLFFQTYFTQMKVSDLATFDSYALLYLQRYDPDFATEYIKRATKAVTDQSLSPSLTVAVKEILYGTDVYEKLRLLLFSDSDVADEAARASYLWMKDLGYDFERVEASFEYSMYFKNIKGQDPDEVYVDSDGQTVYKWKLDPLNDNTFTITQKVPTVWVWELTCILGGVIAALICVVLIILRKKNKQAERVVVTNDENSLSEDKKNELLTYIAQNEEKTSNQTEEQNSNNNENDKNDLYDL